MRTISARQTGIIIFLTILANKILLLPSIMYQETKADSIFGILGIFFVELLILSIFLYVKLKFPNENLQEILQKKIGHFCAKLIIFIFLIFFLFKTMLTYSVIYVYLKDLVYQDEFGFLAIVCFLPVVNHGVICGLRSISRTFELFFYLVIAGILFCFGIAFFTEISMPVFFTANPLTIFNTSFKYLFSFGDYLALFVFIEKINLKKNDVKKFLRFVILGILIVSSIFVIFYAKYQITAFMHNNALADLLVFSVQFNAIGRLDIVAMLTIMTLGLFQLEIFQYAFCESFSMVFTKLNNKFAIAVFDILFFVIYFILIGKYELMINFTTSYLCYFSLLSNFLLPFIIFAVSFSKNKRIKNKGVRDEKSN